MVPTKVHLLVSIALDSVEEVFRTVGTVLGRRLRRVPDGEPGGREVWQLPEKRPKFNGRR
jgi:hypothetical protein